MKFISEEIINPIIDRISDNEEVFDKSMVEFAEAQPFLLSFLMSEGFDILNEEEKSLFYYLAIVIFYSVKAEYEDIELIELETIEHIDEANWTIVDQMKYKAMKEIADHFFQDYVQEDLLAFVEDALAEDEEYSISNIGRNVIFVSMKSIIDVLDNEVN